MFVCVCVCLRLRVLITSGEMWLDMDLIQLVKQVLQLLYGNCSCSVIRVGVAYMNVCVSRRLKDELDWAIDKQLQLIIKDV